MGKKSEGITNSTKYWKNQDQPGLLTWSLYFLERQPAILIWLFQTKPTFLYVQ